MPIAVHAFGEIMWEGPTLKGRLMGGLLVEASLFQVCAGQGINKKVIRQGDDIIVVIYTVGVVGLSGESIGFVGSTNVVDKGDVVIAKGEDMLWFQTMCLPSPSFVSLIRSRLEGNDGRLNLIPNQSLS